MNEEVKIVSEESRPYKLYMHTSPSGKRYIGITSTEPEERWGVGGHRYKSQKRFYNSIKHYGWDNFKHEILVENLTKEEAEKLEIEYIKKYRTTEEEYGYNWSPGGLGSSTGKQIICLTTLEVFHSMVDASNSYHISVRALTAYILRHKGDPHYFCGEKDSEKLVWDLYDPTKSYTKTNYIYYPSIICISTLETFDSIAEASRIKGFNEKTLHKHLKGGNIFCGIDDNGDGMLWEYYDKDKIYEKKVVPKEEIFGLSYYPEKLIICLNTGVIFNNFIDANIWCGLERRSTSISDVCKGNHKHAGRHPITGERLKWAFYEKNENYCKYFDSGVNSKCKPVICLNTLQIFLSSELASKEFGVASQLIRRACNGEIKSAGYSESLKESLRWRYYDKNEKYEIPEIKITKRNNIPIMCVETYQTFSSISRAARELHISKQKLMDCCKTGESYKGYHFKYVE